MFKEQIQKLSVLYDIKWLGQFMLYKPGYKKRKLFQTAFLWYKTNKY